MSVARRQGIIGRVLRRRGTSITLVDGEQAFDPGTLGTSGGPGTETHLCTPPTPFRAELVDGTNVVQGDLETSVNAADWTTVTPEAGLIATVAGETYHVIAAMPLFEDSTIYGYRLQLRGTQ